MPVSAETYERVALEDPEGKWELVCGELRRKPPMTMEHYQTIRTLIALLIRQLDPALWTVGETKVRVPSGSYRIADVTVIPMTYVRKLGEQRGAFEVYDGPMPLIVEVWSPSTGEYDFDTKLEEYRGRAHLEIWYINPYERTLIAWRRGRDGTYTETLYGGGTVEPVALPGVSIDLDALFG